MSHLTEAIFWLALALMMAFCCVVDVINQNWFSFVICSVAFDLDLATAFTEFSVWAKEHGKKAARKRGEDNDT